MLRLRERGVQFRMKHQWVGLERQGDILQLDFLEGNDRVSVTYDAAILAMGGASWPQTGSTGTWVSILEAKGIEVIPLRSANCGWECGWTDETRKLIEGKALQNLKVSAAGVTLTGELLPTRYGFEGTPLYTLGLELRKMDEPYIEIDFKPSFTVERLVAKMESARRNFYKEAGLRWKLNEAACAIIRQYYGDFDNAKALANVVKCCRIPLIVARPIEESISTAGGVAWNDLNESLMLKKLPGVYCAGEMLDWEAPTGGFLMQGCFVTGTIAGKSAAKM